MKINVFGNNINALVCAGCLAGTGNQVTLVGHRNNEHSEPGLTKLLDTQEDTERLTLSKKFDIEAEYQIISFDPEQCEEGKRIAQILSKGQNPKRCIIIRSNFTMGSVKEIERLSKIPCVINPDFASDGRAIQDFMRPDRIIIGSRNDETLKQFKRLFAPFNRNRNVMIEMSPESAELTKYATNAMLATRISLMNELALAAESLGADIEEVRHGIGSDNRIGASYLYAGIGFGGTHFAKDLCRIHEIINPSDSKEGLLEAVLRINEQQKEALFRKVWQHFDCHIENKIITLWGISYKPNSNSIEGAPSLALIKAFLNQGATVQVFDPMLDANFMIWMRENISLEQQKRLILSGEMYNATHNADALCVITEWQSFLSPDLDKLKHNMNTPLILDGRNLYDKQWIQENQFTYYGIGR
ncbi:UDP-glucose 6-dehydrogenase [hydrothermal vent metagenome]|uniref:UDP-glucose 6-dehydrogenase n=1 Tax=hydrothermal vent metagenome TaxID=652676 RepID=A0A3B0VYP4_9ZZZZ